MLVQVGYDSTSIVVNSDFNKDMMHKHLHTLSANKDLAMKEEHDIITIHKLLKVTKERLYKQAKNMTSEHNINTIQKYIKELTTTIPMLTRSMVITNSYMYTDYKNNIKKIYHAIETTY
jgi:mannose/fructose/N-acetylgalactosamine-specific phosphotransferase system component IIB